MKKLIYIICVFCLTALCTHDHYAFAQSNPRDFIDGQFIGLETTLVYQENSVVKVEPYITKIGRLKRGIDAFPLSNLTTNDLSSLPTVGLAAEHWWLSFELLMIGQRDYAECIAAVNEYHRIKNICLIDDPSCSSIAPLVLTIRDYWVPFNIVFDFGVPSKETYIAHIEAGMSSLNQVIAHRDACRDYLQLLRVELQNRLLNR